ncbi:hypothetical protein B0H17DRAFT_1182352 [Mycena rosella]|uniref:Uncharacterized protein n=1 Tax=Mycena rosella TaxID=1033263 RepID=A0AAD7GCM7_MYCRO|nr:hypothetical protein B0H17DRAFT_1182352 [Mycena rosella]
MKRKCHVNNVLFTFPTAVSRNPAAGALPLVPALRRREATLPVNGCSGQNTVAGPSSNCALLPSHDATHSGDTTVVNTSLAFSDEDLSNITEEGSRLLQGILVHSDCSTVDFLPLYMEDRDPLAVDDPVRDLDAMHPRHSLQRSGWLQMRDVTVSPSGSTLALTVLPSRVGKRPRPVDDVDGVATPPPKKWLDKRGRLLTPDVSWTLNTSKHATISRDTPFDGLAETVARSTPVTRKNHAKPSKGCKTKRGH